MWTYFSCFLFSKRNSLLYIIIIIIIIEGVLVRREEKRERETKVEHNMGAISILPTFLSANKLLVFVCLIVLSLKEGSATAEAESHSIHVASLLPSSVCTPPATAKGQLSLSDMHVWFLHSSSILNFVSITACEWLCYYCNGFWFLYFNKRLVCFSSYHIDISIHYLYH